MRWGPCQRVTPSNLYYRYRVRGYLIDAWATHEWVPIIVTSPRGPLADVGIIEGTLAYARIHMGPSMISTEITLPFQLSKSA